jgi:23S rRNA (uracil1939-C5)-methyltransferase
LKVPFLVNIERIIPGGHGLAFHEGRATFVPLSVPGDRILIHQFRDKRHYLEAQSIAVVEGSAQRVVPPCPHFGDCGGCDFQHMTYERQLLSKQEILLDTLNRVGKIRLLASDISLIPSPPFAYRNRLQLKVSNCGTFSWGFFANASHRVCSVKRCLIASEELWQFLPTLERLIEGSPSVRSKLQEVEVFQGAQNQYLVDFRVGPTPFSLEQLGQDLGRSMSDWGGSNVNLFLSAPCGEVLKVWGTGRVWKSVGDFEYRVSRGSFFQINDLLLGKLLDSAVAGLSGKRALDLYCGVGFFSLGLARSFEEVWAVEKNPFAIEDLRENVLRNQVCNIKIFPQDLGDFIRRSGSLLKDFDLVLLDPPRSGLAKGSVAQVAMLGVPDVVYVSCDPSTLARDLRIFLNHQYELSSLKILDLFPQTHHLETIAMLSKKVQKKVDQE